MNDLRTESILLCPRNDEESLQIIEIAEKLGVKVLISEQPHGAKLSREKDLVVRMQELHPDAKGIVIVEIPGEKDEQELRDLGYEVMIIDHHTYDELDRMNAKSSIEQFLDLYEIDELLLRALGFDPVMIEAVGAIDRGFVWELEKLGWSESQKAKARKYYRELTMQLGSPRREREEEAAHIAWKGRREEGGVLIVESDADDVSIRDAISFIIADEIGQPTTTIIRQGTRRIYVQETDETPRLKAAFGGFTFGQNRCWGVLREDGTLPSVDEVKKILTSKE